MANQDQQHVPPQMSPSVVRSNQQGVPSVVMAGGQGAQMIPAAALMSGQGGLSAQQLTALAAASGGAVIIPGIPGAQRLPLPMPMPSISNLMLAQGMMVPGAAAAPSSGTAHQAVSVLGYRDFSDGADTTPASASTKDHSFPMKLHKILSDPENAEFITWLPHGRSWRVLKPKALEDTVIPKYFRHAKYASFMRQVNGWGFKRMTQGPDNNSYYHELFLRGLPKLCQKMKRPSKAAHAVAATSAHPDFYTMSLYAPLPAAPSTNSVATSTADTNNYSNNAANNNSGSDASDRGVVTSSTTNNFSESDTSEHGIIPSGSGSGSSTTAYPQGMSSDSDRNYSSDPGRNGGSSGEGSGGLLDEDRIRSIRRRFNSGSSDGCDEASVSDRFSSSFTEDRSDPSDTERISSSESNGSPLAAKKRSGRKRRHPRQKILQRADSSFMRESGSESSGRSSRSSLRDLSAISASLLSNIGKEGDLPSIVGGTAIQDVSTPRLPSTVGSSSFGLPALPGSLSSGGQQGVSQQASSSITSSQPSGVTNQRNAAPPQAHLSAANHSAANQQAPLTASNLGYLSLQNQLIQCQATIAQLLAYQQAMGLPPMPAPGAPFPTPAVTTPAAPGPAPPPSSPGDKGKE